VRNLGLTSQVWSDHADIQPTMLALAGLRNDYGPDGRVLNEFLQRGGGGRELTELGVIYKQINAPFGQLSFDVLAASTRAIASGSETNDSTYAAISDRIAALTARRDTLAGEMRDVLNEAAFGGHLASASEIEDLTMEGKTLLMQAHQLGAAGSP